MFVNAIEQVGGFTRPIFTITRRYGTAQVDPGSATLFFVNEEGWAVTCKHVAAMVIDAAAVEKKYNEFRAHKSKIHQGYNFEDELKRLEETYQYDANSLAQMKVTFVDCVDFVKGVQCKLHPKADLALIKFDGFQNVVYKAHAVFAADGGQVRQGKFLCRLGFPFPEFKNFTYDVERDDILWTKEGNRTSPRFPTEGMVTRLIGTEDGITGIELSTPGMKGQSGGPLFDRDGIVCGMQSAVSSLNLGQCVHVDVIKACMEKENVKYYTDKKAPLSSLS